MDKIFELNTEPYVNKQKIFAKNTVTIHEGLTVLVGCNGSGKTSMLRQMRKQLEDDGAAVMYYDYGYVREHKDRLLQCGDIPAAQFASWVSDSEGEQIVVSVSLLAAEIGKFVRTHPNQDIYFLLDAVDSGLSIDNIDDMKTHLFSFMINDVQSHGNHIYIVVTANSYEMAAGVLCIDASACEDISFSTYGQYRSFILDSAKRKSLREENTWAKNTRRKK